MKQSRLMSLVESLANVLVGYGVAVGRHLGAHRGTHGFLARRAGAADFGAQADQGAKRLVGQALPQFIETRQVGAGVHAASDSGVVAVALT